MFKQASVLLTLCFLLPGCVIVADVDSDWDWGESWIEREQEFSGQASRVDFSATGTLYITQGEYTELAVEGHRDALKHLDIDERQGTVFIDGKLGDSQWYNRGGKEPIYRLSIPNLEAIHHTGRGILRIGPISGEQIQIKAEDHASTYVASLNAQQIEIEVGDHARVSVETADASGMRLMAEDHGEIYLMDASVLDTDIQTEDHGELVLKGQTDTVKIVMRDQSDVDARDFKASVGSIRASDHADAYIDIDDQVRLEQRDQAVVKLHGNPKIETEAKLGD